ncbi:MAG: HD domain-containing protein [Verrucomicrobia bacterium]|nr:MAG: HD domain-containing protein [Verrucomicrobiota bacterium]
MKRLENSPAGRVATRIVRRLREADYDAFFVGGCVRDMLLGRPPGDIDIATSAPPEEVERLFVRTVPVGRQFGVMLVLEGGFEFQVSTFRTESGYRDGRRPDEVRFASAREDASRRDFTVNGLYYDPLTGELHDWVGGQADLKARLIRTIGPPEERFAEDRLRLLRAVRLAAQLGFEIEPATWAAIPPRAAELRMVSAERIREELLKLFQPPGAARGLRLLQASGLLKVVLPEVEACRGCEQPPEFHPEGDVFEHIVLMLEHLPADAPPLLPWAVLLHDIGKPRTARRDPETGLIRFHGHASVGAVMAESVLRRLRFPVRDIRAVSEVVRHHMQFLEVARMRRSTLRRIMLRPTFPLEMELHRLDCLGARRSLETYEILRRAWEEFRAKPELRPPLVNGNDLIALGMPRGRELGRLLARIRDKQLAEELRTREEALAWAAQEIRSMRTASSPGGDASKGSGV